MGRQDFVKHANYYNEDGNRDCSYASREVQRNHLQTAPRTTRDDLLVLSINLLHYCLCLGFENAASQLLAASSLHDL